MLGRDWKSSQSIRTCVRLEREIEFLSGPYARELGLPGPEEGNHWRQRALEEERAAMKERQRVWPSAYNLI
jgi:hypothetical protein